MPNVRLRVLPKIPPINGRDLELRTTATFIQWRLAGEAFWNDLIAVADLVGATGPAVEIRSDGAFIQYRPADDDGAAWTNIIPLTDIKGDKGDPPALSFLQPITLPAGQPVTQETNPIPGGYEIRFSIPGGATGPTPAVVPQGRLSLVSGMPVAESDVTGATSIYYVPASGSYLPVFDGGGLVARSVGAQLTLPLNANAAHIGYHQLGKNFDLFGIFDAGAVKLGTGPAWSSDVLRGVGAGTTELELFNGLLVNKNAISIRTGSASGDVVAVPARQATYLGSFRATANGQATDTGRQRLLFNSYNQTLRPMQAVDPAASWNYNVASYRQANNNAANQLEFLLGLSGVAVRATCNALVANSTATERPARTAIGLDSTTSYAPGSLAGWMSNGTGPKSMQASYEGFPGLGRHILTRLEMGAGADDQTWFGTNGTIYQTGINGSLVS